MICTPTHLNMPRRRGIYTHWKRRNSSRNVAFSSTAPSLTTPSSSTAKHPTFNFNTSPTDPHRADHDKPTTAHSTDPPTPAYNRTNSIVEIPVILTLSTYTRKTTEKNLNALKPHREKDAATRPNASTANLFSRWMSAESGTLANEIFNSYPSRLVGVPYPPPLPVPGLVVPVPICFVRPIVLDGEFVISRRLSMGRYGRNASASIRQILEWDVLLRFSSMDSIWRIPRIWLIIYRRVPLILWLPSLWISLISGLPLVGPGLLVYLWFSCYCCYVSVPVFGQAGDNIRLDIDSFEMNFNEWERLPLEWLDWLSVEEYFFEPFLAMFVMKPNERTIAICPWASGPFVNILLLFMCICTSFLRIRKWKWRMML